MKLLSRIIVTLGFILLLMVARPIAAQDVIILPPDTTVVVPWGYWVDLILTNAIQIVTALVVIALGWASRALPEAAQNWFRTQQVEQLLARSIQFGLNAVAGAVKDKSLSVNVGSQVLATSANFAITHGPEKLIEWMGGVQGIKDKILARIDLAEGATVDEVRNAAPQVLGEATAIPTQAETPVGSDHASSMKRTAGASGPGI